MPQVDNLISSSIELVLIKLAYGLDCCVHHGVKEGTKILYSVLNMFSVARLLAD